MCPEIDSLHFADTQRFLHSRHFRVRKRLAGYDDRVLGSPSVQFLKIFAKHHYVACGIVLTAFERAQPARARQRAAIHAVDRSPSG